MRGDSSSRPGMFCKKGFLKNFAKFAGKQMCQSLFFYKVEDMRRWCDGYYTPTSLYYYTTTLLHYYTTTHYYTTSLNKAWTQVLRRLKSCSWCVGNSRWWGSLTMVLAENRAKRLSSVNHNTKTIHHHVGVFLWILRNFKERICIRLLPTISTQSHI